MNTTQTETGTETRTEEAPMSAIEMIRKSLIETANGHMAQWPQYVGHFDAYRVGRVTKAVRTKLGVAFEKGELVIWTTSSDDRGRGPEVSFTAYSVRNRCDTGLPRAFLDVEPTICTRSGVR